MKRITALAACLTIFSSFAHTIKFINTEKFEDTVLSDAIERRLDDGAKISILNVKHSIGIHAYNIIATPLSLGVASVGFRKLTLTQTDDAGKQSYHKCDLIADLLNQKVRIANCSPRTYSLNHNMSFFYEELGIEL